MTSEIATRIKETLALNQNIKYQKACILGNAVYNTTPGETPMKPNTAMAALGGSRGPVFAAGMNLFGDV